MLMEGAENKAGSFLKRYKTLLLSVILSIYSLPLEFYIIPNAELDGSWTRAINMAIKNHLVFGTDFVFTYGPLGFLSTRYNQYIPNIWLLLGDLFLFAGIFHFIYRYLSKSKEWFFILLFALLFFRGVNYSQGLFLMFIVFTSLSFKNNFASFFETAYCALSGVLLFFIKINYGIFTLILLPVIAVFLLARNRKALLIFVVPAVLFFGLIYFNVHIDLVNYVRNSLPLIKYYDESMYLAIVPGELPFISGMIMIASVFLLSGNYLFRFAKQRNYSISIFLLPVLLCLTCFLLYKNGYTRYDGEHYGYFFSVFPLFLVAVIFLLGYERFLLSRVVCVIVMLLSGSNLLLPLIGTKSFNLERAVSYVNPFNYFCGIFEENNEHVTADKLFDRDKRKFTANSTIDIFPTQIAWLQFNKLDYRPRPVPQSYSAYCGSLDSLNASFFLKKERPELVLISNESIDDRYAIWDESLTKATIYLNYNDCDTFNEDWQLRYSYPKMLLLRSKTDSYQYPKFEKMSTQTISPGDTVRFNFPDSIPVYMTADIRYNLAGQLRKIFYQPPPISVTLLIEDKGNVKFEAVRPIMMNPVLINKAVLNNSDLRKFFTRKITACKNIGGFVFNADSSMFEKKITISFLKFSNY